MSKPLFVLWNDLMRDRLDLLGPFDSPEAVAVHVATVNYMHAGEMNLVVTGELEVVTTYTAKFRGLSVERRDLLEGMAPVPVTTEKCRVKVLSRKGLNVILHGVGNPDFQQYSDVAPRQVRPVKNLLEASAVCREYIAEHELGGGNWGRESGLVLRDGVPYAQVSWNGRVWLPGQDMKPHPDAPESVRGILR